MMPLEELFPTAGPDVRSIVETLVPGGVCAQSGQLILPIQGFLLKTPTHNILVDSCVGNDKTLPQRPEWHKRSSQRFIAGFAAAGLDVCGDLLPLDDSLTFSLKESLCVSIKP